jgi:hypothetical protein
MTMREAMGYFVQLRDLYALKLTGGREPRLRYRLVSEAELRDLQTAAFEQGPA